MSSTIKTTDEIIHIISGVYFGMRASVIDRMYWLGAVKMASSIVLALGRNPEQFLFPEDMQLLKKG